VPSSTLGYAQRDAPTPQPARRSIFGRTSVVAFILAFPLPLLLGWTGVVDVPMSVCIALCAAGIAAAATGLARRERPALSVVGLVLNLALGALIGYGFILVRTIPIGGH
jgi:hypothetical protein